MRSEKTFFFFFLEKLVGLRNKLDIINTKGVNQKFQKHGIDR